MCVRQVHSTCSVSSPEYGCKDLPKCKVNQCNWSEEWSASGLLHGTSTSAVQSLRPSNDEVLAHQSEEGYWVGVELKYKFDKKLFRRYTCSCNALQKGNECAFADDGALLYPSGQVLRWLQ